MPTDMAKLHKKRRQGRLGEKGEKPSDQIILELRCKQERGEKEQKQHIIKHWLCSSGKVLMAALC